MSDNPFVSGGNGRIRKEEIREPMRTRKRKGTVDKFYIDPKLIPEGLSYEWKRETVYGMSDPGYEVALRENGWLPVDVTAHPEFMPPGYKGAIKRDGMVLMERPAHLTQEAREEEQELARTNLQAQIHQIAQAPPGTMTRDHPTARPRVGSSIEPIAVPKD